MNRGEGEKKNKLAIIIWGMFGIITSMIVSCMILVGSVNFDKFYDVGEVYEFYTIPACYNAQFDKEKNVFTVLEENPYEFLNIHMDDMRWGYLEITIDDMEKEPLDGVLIFYNENDEEVGEQRIELKKGKNSIEIIDGFFFSKVQIIYELEVGETFGIQNIKFLEKKTSFCMSSFLEISGLILGGYILLSVLGNAGICKVCKKYNWKLQWNWYGCIEKLQKIFIIAGERMGSVVQTLDKKKRACIRKCLFAFMFLHMQMAKNLGWYETKSTYKYQILLCVVLFILIAGLCYEKELKLQNWKNPLVGAWICLWIMACISDFIVPKRYAWIGYAMIGCVGFLFFMWNNMENRMELMSDILDGALITFGVNIVFCFLCRPEIEGTRYMGGYYNPVMFARYLACICVILLYRINKKLERSIKIYAYIPELILGGIGITMLWKTQSASGIYPLFVIGIFFLIHQIRERRKPRKIMVLLGMTIALFIPVYIGTDWCLNTIPYKLNTIIKFENDTSVIAEEQSGWFSQTVYAADTSVEDKVSESRIIKKIVDMSWSEMLSYRDYYWKAYIREINLFGHKEKALTLWGNKGCRAHNGFLQIIYRYGIYALIPYCIMIFMNIKYAWHSYKEKREDGFLCVMVCTLVTLILLIENVEFSFLYLDWFLMYLLMGSQFTGKAVEKYCGENEV